MFQKYYININIQEKDNVVLKKNLIINKSYNNFNIISINLASKLFYC